MILNVFNKMNRKMTMYRSIWVQPLFNHLISAVHAKSKGKFSASIYRHLNASAAELRLRM